MNKLAMYLNQHLIGEVVTDTAVLAKFSTDGSPLTKTPEMVVYPRVTNDVRKLLRFTWQLAEKGHSLPVTARGAGTDRTGAAIGSGVVLSTMSHLNAIFEYDAKQRLVRLQSGVSVTALQNALKLQGTWVPALSGVADDVTVGGVIAAGRTFPSTGEWIDQLEIALANGDVLQTKRLTKRELSKKKGQQGFEGDIYRGLDALIEDNQQLIDEQLSDKSSSGYSALTEVKRKDGSFDLTPLFTGSQGTLGIITEMIVKAEFTGTNTGLAIGVFDDATKARDVLDKVVKVEPSRLEYFDGQVLKRAQASGKQFSFLETDANPAAVLVATLNDSTGRAQQKKAKKLAKLFSQFDGAVYQTEDMADSDLANVRSIVSLALQADGRDEASVPLVDGAFVPLERFERFAEGVVELATKRRVSLPLYGLPLEGIWYTRPVLNLKTVGGKQSVFKLIDEFNQLVEQCDGQLASQNGEGRLQDYSIRKSADPEIQALFDAIKKLFDPHGILNTGVKQSDDVRDIAGMLRSGFVPGHADGLPRL